MPSEIKRLMKWFYCFVESRYSRTRLPAMKGFVTLDLICEVLNVDTLDDDCGNAEGGDIDTTQRRRWIDTNDWNHNKLGRATARRQQRRLSVEATALSEMLKKVTRWRGKDRFVLIEGGRTDAMDGWSAKTWRWLWDARRCRSGASFSLVPFLFVGLLSSPLGFLHFFWIRVWVGLGPTREAFRVFFINLFYCFNYTFLFRCTLPPFLFWAS